MIKSTLFILATAAGLASAQTSTVNGGPKPEIPLDTSQWTNLGCYSPTDSETGDVGVQMATSTLTFNSPGACMERCNLMGAYLYPWAALGEGNKCYCGQEFTNKKTDKSECNIPCPGYDRDTCGGAKALNIYQNEAAIKHHEEKGTLSTKTVPPVWTTQSAGPSSTASVSVSASASATGNGTAAQTSGSASPLQTSGAAGKLGAAYGVLGMVAGAGLLAL
ncbi:hypothetical protein QBC44DRAFT_317684 [Cladorrhinum sp. PSN332]|nr:hypothetical protein QBC44DRAFT_317684 [Cladorrhinum sp. PSN332]